MSAPARLPTQILRETALSDSTKQETDYTLQVSTRLERSGFRISQNVHFGLHTFDIAAAKTEFRVERGGIFRTVIALRSVEKPTPEQLKHFSTSVYRYTNKGHGWLPPRIAFYGTQSLAVAVAESVDNETVKAVEGSTPPKHWCAEELVVLFDLKKGSLYYYRTTPLWGSLYHEQNQKFIEAMFALPSAGSPHLGNRG